MAFEQYIKPADRNVTPKLATPNLINVLHETISPFGAISGAEAKTIIEHFLTVKNPLGGPFLLDQDSIDDMVDLRQVLDDVDALVGKSPEEKMARKVFTVQALYRILTLYAQASDVPGYTTQAEVVMKLRNIVPTWR